MFDEDLFSVFNETASSAEKPGSHTKSGSSRNTGMKTTNHDDKGNSEKADNKRYESPFLGTGSGSYS